MTIQKCKPSFDEGNVIVKRAPFTQLYNKVLQTCTNMEAIAVWAYLQSQADNWELSPSQLKKHFRIGKNKVYDILTYMIDTNLLVRNVHRSANGRKEKTSYTVLDGTQYLNAARPIQESVQECAPLPQNQEVENQEVENGDTKKERDLEKKDSEKDINNISASDDAPANEPCSFDEFWNIYPIKKNKIRARKIWERKKLNKIAELIMNDVSHRQVNDNAWADEQFIPHPSTYLQNELWNDAVTQCTYKQHLSKNSGGDALSRVFKKHTANQGATYDKHGNAVNPLR